MKTIRIPTTARLRGKPKGYLPTFKMGAGSIFNLAGNYYDFSYPKSTQGDMTAIQKDWIRVGEDMKEAIRIFSVNNGTKPK